MNKTVQEVRTIVLPIKTFLTGNRVKMCLIESSQRLTHNDDIPELIHRKTVAKTRKRKMKHFLNLDFYLKLQSIKQIKHLYISDVLFILRRVQAGRNTLNKKQEYYKLITTFRTKKVWMRKTKSKKKFFMLHLLINKYSTSKYLLKQAKFLVYSSFL